MDYDYAFLIVVGLAFVLAWGFNLQAERDRKRFERARGSYCSRAWRDRSL